MKLLALIVAFAISHYLKNPEVYRKFSWLTDWRSKFESWSPFDSSELNGLLVLFLPVILLMTVLHLLFDSGFAYFLVSIAVLVYCIGPKNLEEEIEKGDFRKNYGIEESASGELVIKKMTKIARQRWFGVFFWYVVLGLPGALIYRLTERLFVQSGPEEEHDVYNHLLTILNYPVSWMMVLALAIASDFDQVLKKTRSFFSWKEVKSMEDSFIFDSMSFAVNNCEIEDGSTTNEEQMTYNVLKRMLLVWLVIVSTLIIFDVF